jgi:arylsulfatase
VAPESGDRSIDRTVLPPPDPAFRGTIEVALKDSTADFPEPMRAPKGAPNVLLIMGDDVGYGHMSAFAEIDNPDGDAQGVLVTLGGETGGYALYVLEGKPTFVYNWLGVERYAITSAEPLPKGECTIVFDFAYDGGPGKGGTGTLRVNDRTVGEGRIDKTVPVYFSTDDTFDVGEDWGTPISDTYEPPFTFTGKIKKATVQAKSP